MAYRGVLTVVHLALTCAASAFQHGPALSARSGVFARRCVFRRHCCLPAPEMSGGGKAHEPGRAVPQPWRPKVLANRELRSERFEEERQRHARHEASARQRIKIQRAYAMRLAGLESKQCPACWLPTDTCVCDGDGPVLDFPHTVVLYMHLKEYTKTSNTGCLLQVQIPVLRSEAVSPRAHAVHPPSLFPPAVAHVRE